MAFIDLAKDINEIELAPGVFARPVHSENMTVMHVRLENGADVPEHNHPHEQIVNVVKGTLELTVEGKPHRLSMGRVFVLGSNVPHSAKALEDTIVVDVFSPVREDLK